MSKEKLTQAVQAVSGLAPREEPPPYARGAPSRHGKKGIVIYVDPAAAKKLRQMALDSGRSLQSLGQEAINGLFEKYGEKPIA
jgi:Antitoxin-like ribbon-helix-helix